MTSTPDPKMDWSGFFYFLFLLSVFVWCVGAIVNTVFQLITGVK